MDQQTKEIFKKAREEIEELKKSTLADEVAKKVIKQLQPLFKDSLDMVEIVKELTKEPEIRRKEMLEALSNIKIEPKNVILPDIKVPRPEVTVNPPDIKIPPQPRPIIKVSPADVRIPETKFPKEMKVTGLASFVKAVLVILRGKINVVLNGVNRDNPLPVILTDEKGIFYKALATLVSQGGGGAGGIAFIQGYGSVGGGNVTTAAGAAKQLSSKSIPCKRVIVHAVGGHIVVGGSSVDYTEASRNGIWLAKTQREVFNVSNVNLLYVDSLTNVLVAFYYED